jgi:hypothetical protein
MITDINSEDRLVQQTFAEHLESVAMERAARTGARPPHTRRRPRRGPLSRASGATPTSAAIGVRVRVPSSWRSASPGRLRTGPTPGVVRSRVAVARQRGRL